MKRLVTSALIALCALAIGISPTAGATPTHLSGVSSAASAGGYDPNSGVSFSLQVQVGWTTYNRAGQHPFTIFTDTVFADFDFSNVNGSGFGFGCWVVPASDFAVNSDLSATLTFDSSDPQVTECPGDPVSASGLSTPGLVENLVGPITINATWSPSGPVVFTRTVQQRSCQPVAMTIGVGTSQNVDAVPAAAISGAFEDPAVTFSAPNIEPTFGYVSVFSGQNQDKGTGDFCPGP